MNTDTHTITGTHTITHNHHKITDTHTISQAQTVTQSQTQSHKHRHSHNQTLTQSRTLTGSGQTYGGGPYFGKTLLQGGGVAFVVRIRWNPGPGREDSEGPVLDEVRHRRWVVGASEGASVQTIPGWNPRNDVDGDGSQARAHLNTHTHAPHLISLSAHTRAHMDPRPFSYVNATERASLVDPSCTARFR